MQSFLRLLFLHGFPKIRSVIFQSDRSLLSFVAWLSKSMNLMCHCHCHCHCQKFIMPIFFFYIFCPIEKLSSSGWIFYLDTQQKYMIPVRFLCSFRIDRIGCVGVSFKDDTHCLDHRTSGQFSIIFAFDYSKILFIHNFYVFRCSSFDSVGKTRMKNFSVFCASKQHLMPFALKYFLLHVCLLVIELEMFQNDLQCLYTRFMESSRKIQQKEREET